MTTNSVKTVHTCTDGTRDENLMTTTVMLKHRTCVRRQVITRFGVTKIMSNYHWFHELVQELPIFILSFFYL